MYYRKKPAVIEAFQFDNQEEEDFPEWLQDAIKSRVAYSCYVDVPYFIIKTLEGSHRANIGDWIIKGMKGELCVCKPDIFAIMYEPLI